MKVRILREPEIRQLLTYPEVIQAVEKCFADYSAGRAILPGVINLDIASVQGEVHVKSAHILGEEHYVIKVASGFYLNPSRGLPVGNGMMLLFEAQTGLLRCLMMDNAYITEMRTAAAGAVAADSLAKKNIQKVGLVGSGSQARFQLKALLEVRRPVEILVWSRRPEKAALYVDEMAGLFPELRFRPAVRCEDAVRDSDLIITVTPSRSPLVEASWLSAGAHITAVGSDGPDKQELEADVLKKADKIFCDSIVQCSRLGEVHHGLEAGEITEDRISGELGELVLGKKTGRENAQQITLADLTGLGVQDAAASSLVYRKAVAEGIGDFLDI